ncbi:MAG: asparagine synthase (glutamine-hydrolyzing) [Bacteroidetes bacterium]|nr:asparagine synthase (glutamine-hydrolyzing) [Bacteroidota bacterium]
MCGIAGIVSLNGTGISLIELQKFTDALNHRGPDGSGYELLNNDTVAFGHRRLSILDLSVAGKQPMFSSDKRLAITYNGEIYNFIELRKELEKEGFRFQTETDTEVILAAYQKWGRDCFHKFNGMWAIALYNCDTKELLLCRDRFGVKPLYYIFKPNDIFAFASETVAFKYLEDFKLVQDEDLISRAIDNPVLIEGTGHTIWQGVHQILGGHFIEITNKTTSIQQKRWFEIPKKTISISYDEAKEEFFKLSREAVKLRLRSDVPIATALSGGLDSSSVYAMLHYLKKQNLNSERVDYTNIKGFVATFEGTQQDETDYAKAVVEFCNGEAEFIKTDFDSIIRNIESSTRLFNDITATPINVLGDVYKSMRHNKYLVSLDGHGVDEMLYGYRSLVGMAITQAIVSLDKDYEKDLSQTYLDMFHSEFRQEEMVKLNNRYVQLKDLLSINSHLGKIKYSFKQHIKKVFTKGSETFQLSDHLSLSSLSKTSVAKLKQLSDKPIDLNFYNIAEKELAIDFYYRNIPYNMRDFDRAAMQHGIEIRMPFMDYNLVNFVFSLPMEYKVGHGYSKRIMRDALKTILPEKISKRKLKIGMGAPIHDWFNHQLNQYLMDTVSSQKFLQNNLWNGSELKKFAEQKCQTKNWQPADAQQFWNVLNAHLILS